MNVLTALLTSLAAHLGSYLGSRYTSAPQCIAGRPMDKLNEGQLFTDKLNRLRGYRRRRSAWLSSQATETLDVTIRQLVWSADYFNALPKSPHGQQSTNPHT